MAGFNLIRKRRRRLPLKTIGIVVAVLLVLGGAVVAYMQYSGKPILGSADDEVEVRFVDKSALANFQEDPSSSIYLEYLPVDEAKGVYARGVNLTFTVLPKSSVTGSVNLESIELLVKSFTPLDKLNPAPTYEPPTSKDEINPLEEDVEVRLQPGPGQSSTVTWQPETFKVPDGPQQVAAKATNAKSPETTVVLATIPGGVALSTINSPDTKSFVARIILATPGRADMALRVRYNVDGTKGMSSSPATVSLLYNPDVDAGSVVFLQKNFDALPTFPHARELRDALLKAGKNDDALAVAKKYRNADPGPDADWLVGDTYRTMGEYQKAADEGLLSFYRESKEFSGDRLKRFEEARAWLTEMKESGKIKLSQ